MSLVSSTYYDRQHAHSESMVQKPYSTISDLYHLLHFIHVSIHQWKYNNDRLTAFDPGQPG